MCLLTSVFIVSLNIIVKLLWLYSTYPFPVENTFQDPQWMSETSNNAEPYIYTMFFF